MKKAIYLSGGGARGAYQAGVLKAIHNITKAKQLPVQVLSSVSAGAINAAFLAMYAEDFAQGIAHIIELWSSLTSDQVFRTSSWSLIKSLVRNVFNMIFHYQGKRGGYLLDTKPLKKLLEDNLNFEKINDNVDRELLTDLDMAATCYDSAETISFFYSKHSTMHCRHIRHVAYPTKIYCQHILASSALPLFFPAIKIDGLHYGDGGIQLLSPLSTAIKLGAEKILVIGTRKTQVFQPPASTEAIGEITFAKVLGTMLDALFLDNLDKDLDLVARINEAVELIPANKQKSLDWKAIQTLYIRPSRDLGQLAEGKFHSLPIMLRYLMSMLGAKEQSGDILSFVLFESDYSKTLIDLGYQDAMLQKDKIQDFFS